MHEEETEGRPKVCPDVAGLCWLLCMIRGPLLAMASFSYAWCMFGHGRSWGGLWRSSLDELMSFISDTSDRCEVVTLVAGYPLAIAAWTHCLVGARGQPIFCASQGFCVQLGMFALLVGCLSAYTFFAGFPCSPCLALLALTAVAPPYCGLLKNIPCLLSLHS